MPLATKSCPSATDIDVILHTSYCLRAPLSKPHFCEIYSDEIGPVIWLIRTTKLNRLTCTQSTEHGCTADVFAMCVVWTWPGQLDERWNLPKTSSSLFQFAWFPKPFWPLSSCKLYLWKGLLESCTDRSNKGHSKFVYSVYFRLFSRSFSRSSVLYGSKWPLRD